MPVSQKVLFTALPRGRVGVTNRLSVLVSPRLVTNSQDPTLAEFGDFADWPAKLSEFTWRVRFGSAPNPVEAQVAGPAPRSDLWKALFPKSSFVRSYKFSDHIKGFHNLPVMSFPSAYVHDFLKEKYLQFASSVELPAVQDLIEAYELIGYIDERERLGDLRDLIEEIEGELAELKAIPHSPQANPAKDFAQLLLFHRPASKPNPDPSPTENKYRRVPPKNFKKLKLDFHQALSMLGEHPQLERLLGIVVDLEFTAPTSGDTTVWVEPEWESEIGNANKAVPPVKTRCHVDGSSFFALPRSADPDLSPQGLLRLNDKLPGGADKYRLIQVDHDGAAIKTVNFVNDLKRSQIVKHKTTDTPTESAIPNFRSGGLSIVRTERAKQVHLKLAGLAGMNAQAFEQDQELELSREDLTRGYAYDAYDVQTSRWYPLCRRVGTAKFTGPDPDLEVDLPEETGWVSLAAPQSADGTDDRLRIHESSATWGNNWSMVVPRPGKTVSPDEQPVVHQPNPKDFKLEVSYRAPRATDAVPEGEPQPLPPQRFGRGYHIRARAVDLAGNAVPEAVADATGFQFALGPEAYGRFDPISPPTMVMRKPVTEAESTERMVIRSNYSTAADDTVRNDRHVFPPAIDQVRAEILGELDTPGGVDPDKYAALVARQGGFGDADGNGDPIYPDQEFDEGNYGAPYYDVAVPQFPVENGNTARMPSLPDSLAEGAAFLGLPGAPSGLETYMFFPDTDWPDTLPLLLQTYESASFVPPQLVGIGGARVVQVGLPKAEVFRVRMSSYPSQEGLSQMGLWKWLQDAGATGGDFDDEVLAGQHWGITPGRTLTLTHAVRQPLVPTAFDNPVLHRNIGKTFVILQDRLHTSRKSTERLDMRAEWTEVEDLEPEDDSWEHTRTTPVQALAFQKRIDLDDGPDNLFPIAERHELHHTRHIPEVTYSTIGTTRFKEYFVDRKELTFAKPPASQALTLDSQWTGPAQGTTGVVPESETVQNPEGTKTYKRGENYEMDYEAGTITRKVAAGSPPKPLMPAKVKASYLVPPITREDTPPAQLRVLSSARPEAPNVLYAVPNFTWERSGTGPIISERGGGSLRVYMDRPWWSSGADEMLGVILWDGRGGAPDEPPPALKPFMTQRGQDPLWLSNPQSVIPGKPLFTNRRVFENGEDQDLTLEEVPTRKVGTSDVPVKVQVAAHEVKPDEARRLWYADVDISPEASYFPFIRLALARFQPHSVREPGSGEELDRDVALSRVVLLDYMQLAPDRSATIRFNGETGVTIAVSGLSYADGPAGAGPATMEVTLEQRRPEMPEGDDNLAWIPVPDLDPVALAPQPQGDDTLWLGELTLPQPRGSRPFRLAIREFEPLISSETGAIGRRLVYLDTIEI